MYQVNSDKMFGRGGLWTLSRVWYSWWAVHSLELKIAVW